MLRRFTYLIVFLLHFGFLTAQNEQELYHLASFETGSEGAAETVAFDPATSHAFFTSNGLNKLTILDLSVPKTPTLFMEIDLSPYGGGPNSVATANGVVAVGVQANEKTDPGKIVFFDANGTFLLAVEAGALPDMVVFSPDGTKVLSANEGEPNDDYTIDPEGSVTIVDISGGVGAATVSTVSFAAYNDRKASLMNKGIRIFGNDGLSSVAQDMEPEYIAITADGSLAYVNCQENNAFAVIDLTTNKLLDLYPLGYKDHLAGRPMLESFVLNELVPDWPDLGTPVYDGGQPTVKIGGFSGLYYDPTQSSEDSRVFYAIPDRGPNGDAIAKANVTPAPGQDLRPYKLPDYQANIVKFTLNRQTGAVTLDGQIPLFRQDGVTPISGKGNIPGVDEVPVTYADPNTAYGNTDYVDNTGEAYHELPYDAFGGDFEGILRDKHGDFWMCDENRPAIYKFNPDGNLIERYVPKGTSVLGTTPEPEGTFGVETLPSVYAKRRGNRGFEAIAYDSTHNVIYAFIQSPIENPDASVRNKTDVIRILGIDAATGTPVEEYVYLLEINKYSGRYKSRIDKIGDAVYTGNGQFLVLERDSELPGVTEGKKYVFKVDLKGATNILGTELALRDTLGGAPTLEQLSADELLAEGVHPVHKLKIANLPTLNYNSSDKSEGIALLPGNEIAVINDNDFGLAGAGVSDNTVLGIISFLGDNGMDASDKDDSINIAPRPVLGMYLPDAIAAYEANGATYIVTANEGDSRDYDGYSEEERVKDLALDPDVFPDASDLQKDKALGRLKTTSSLGDLDGDGDYDEIYSYGARSFSIFDGYGNLVFDSGSDFAAKAAQYEPDLFNEDGGTKDGRSDDKGVEPEAVGIGTIGDFTYAFIGFERQSAIVVYDITDPTAPEFITYYNNRTVDSGAVSGDVSPEIIKFVPADESPNGENLLIVGYEVSGSVGIIQVGGEIVAVSEQIRDNARFKAFPVPATDWVHFDQPVSGQIFDASGRLMTVLNSDREVNVSSWEPGMYVIATPEQGTRRFLKLK
ncbi:MAG TPA: esterase-like activity of phytase family protein [Flavilitoribacter sp.]|nr:esterase-like activity of phytase family protein [Flavilitoribacter sp.]HMQ86133.1 esterase-like activity of phytase family protein [Flavilitoribacter sp.]